MSDRLLDGTIRFIAFKKPFEETIIAENLLKIEQAEETLSKDGYRVFPVAKERLLEEGSEFENEQQRKMGSGAYVGDKWGNKYLKAPDIFNIILEKGGDNIIKLTKIADINTVSWSRKGMNSELMHKNGNLPNDIMKTKVLKSPKDLKSIFVDEKELSFELNLELLDQKDIKYAPILWVDLRHKKHLCHYCPNEIPFTHNFHGINPKDKNSITLCGLLNSTLSHLFSEIFSRTGLGGGAGRVLVNDLRRNYIIVNPELINESELENIFTDMMTRQVSDIFEECGINTDSEISISEQDPQPLPDRAELDSIIFDALDLSDKERKEVYRAVCQLVWNRISKARSV